jgi:hypothetical protein
LPGWVNFKRSLLGQNYLLADTEVRLPVGPVPGLEVRLADGTVLRGGSAAELAALVRALRA